MKAVKSNDNLKKITYIKPLQFQLFIFYKLACLQKKLSQTTIHLGIFLGRALWADSVSLRMNAIASHDQFKPARIGENLVVNYNDP